jgi:hypothetical protein
VALLLLLMPVLAPLLRPGFFTTIDGRFHVYRVAGLAKAWQQGVLHPRLFPDFGFGYGQAVLSFYPPLSYWPGSALALVGLAPAATMQVTVGLGFVAAALAAFQYVRCLWGPWAGLLAGVVYTYFPYHLADAYGRGAFPEHFAFVFPPLILWAFTLTFRDENPVPPLLWGALAWAGLVYTHNLTALVMVPIAMAQLLVLAASTGRWRRLLKAAGALALAVGLGGAYWLPVLLESKHVGLSLGPSRGYEDHLLTAGRLLQRSTIYSYAQEAGLAEVHPPGWLSLILLLCGLMLALVRWRQRRVLRGGPTLALHLGVTTIAIFMTTAASLPLWRLLDPVLGYLQYPWRFMVGAAVGLMVIAAALPSLEPRIPPYVWVGILAPVAIVVWLSGLPLEPSAMPEAEFWSPVRMWQEDAASGQVGATWTAEFLPLAVEEQRWALGRPREGAQDGLALAPPPDITLRSLGHARVELAVKSAVPFSVRLHQFHLPAWRAWVDGEDVATYPTGELALVTADVSAGESRLVFQFGPTTAWLAGGLMTTVSGILWAVMAWRSRRGDSPGLTAASVLVVALCVTLALNGLGLGRRERAVQPSQVTVGDVAVLVGWEAVQARGTSGLEVTLYWVALREVGTNLKAFVHLLDARGQVVAQHDGEPVGGFSPTSRWRSGEVIADQHWVLLPQELAPGRYSLGAGMYAPQPMGNLPTDPSTPDGRIILGQIELGAGSPALHHPSVDTRQ